MNNDTHLQGEIDAFWGDIRATEEKLSYDRQNYARRLKNGLGEDIRNYLKNPPKPNKWKGLKMKIKRWWNNKKSRD